MPPSKVRSAPAVVPGPVGASRGRAETLEAPKTHFGSKVFALHSKGFALHSKGVTLYSKGFAPLRVQNGVKMTRVGVVTAGLISMPTTSPKVRSVPAVVPGPVEVSRSRAEALEAPKSHFGSKGFALHSKGFALYSKGVALYSKGVALENEFSEIFFNN